MIKKIAILGGTGDIGAGLVLRLAAIGCEVIIGSRAPEKAVAKAEEYRKILKERGIDAVISGMTNEDAAREAEISILAIPSEPAFSVAEALKECLKNKIVVSTVTPLKKKAGIFLYCPPEKGSASQELASILKGSRIVSAFHTIPAERFANLDEKFQWDVPVCADDAAAKQTVMNLISQIQGLRPIDAGPLTCAQSIESLVPFLINLKIFNKGGDVAVKFDLGELLTIDTSTPLSVNPERSRTSPAACDGAG